MHPGKIAVGELVPPLGVFPFRVIDAQVPFPVFLEPVPAEELVLLLRGWQEGLGSQVPSGRKESPMALKPEQVEQELERLKKLYLELSERVARLQRRMGELEQITYADEVEQEEPEE